MSIAVGIRHQVGVLSRVFGVVCIPDPIDKAVARFQRAVEAGDGVREDLDAWRVVEGEFLDNASLAVAEASISGIVPRHATYPAYWRFTSGLSHRRTGPIRADDEVC